jgi:peptidoglycan hydrolase-like protein with peptidoglycan-binding domain
MSAHAHSKPVRADGPVKGRRGWFTAGILASVAVIAVVVVGIASSAWHGSGGPAAASPTSAPKHGVDASVTTGPLRVVSVTPADQMTAVPSDATVSVQFSVPLKRGSPTPTLSPAVAGVWQIVTADTYMFVASAPLVPSTTETVTIPGGSGGVISAGGKTLTQATTSSFTVAAGNTLRLQQLLAQLGYLPVSFSPVGPLTAPQEAAQPQQGSFSWRWAEPASLESLWTQGTGNQITMGAVMAFESAHDMKTDGVAGPAVWSQLLADAAAGTVTTASYNYVYVSKSLPETATVYSDGTAVYSSLANTGVPGADTQAGTFPVYLRYKVTTMTGTNVDGSKYSDPGIPWVRYFNGGDALHGFVRGSYGFPQSNGCVELPPANAAVIWPMTPIGTLVTVS